MINSVTNVSNYNDDDFDDPFAPSDDSNNSVPTHDDWEGLPWNDEPTDETVKLSIILDTIWTKDFRLPRIP